MIFSIRAETFEPAYDVYKDAPFNIFRRLLDPEPMPEEVWLKPSHVGVDCPIPDEQPLTRYVRADRVFKATEIQRRLSTETDAQHAWLDVRDCKIEYRLKPTTES